MRLFIFLAITFLASAQIPPLFPDHLSSRWVLSGVLLWAGISCLLAGIVMGFFEQ